MKSLKEFINEELINEAAPKFTNNKEGIEAFCDYVFDKEFYTYTINSDLTITLELNEVPGNGVQNAYMNVKDLTEIPSFIVFSNIPEINLGIDSNNKLKSWAPQVKGSCAGIIITDDKKLQKLDLRKCDLIGGKLFVEKSNIEEIIGGKGKNVQVFIRKNKNLKKLDISGFKDCKNPGSYIEKNKSLDLKKAKYPSEIQAN
jgi:hypothetical protein